MKKGISYACILITAFVFSLMEITLKLAGGHATGLNGIQISFWRFVIAVICFFPFILYQVKHHQVTLTSDDWKQFSLLGFIFIVFCMSMYQISCKLEPASIAAIIFSCNPVFTLLFSKIILRKQFSNVERTMLMISLVGMVLVVNPRALLSQLGNWQGILISLLGASSFGLYTVLSKHYLNQKQGSTGFIVSGMSFMCGLVELGVVIGLTHLPVISHFFKGVYGLQVFVNVPVIRNLDWKNIAILLFIGVVITAIGYGCYFYAVETVGSFAASLSFFMKAILSPLLAGMILDERLQLTVVCGIVLVIIGLALPFIFKGQRRLEDGMES